MLGAAVVGGERVERLREPPPVNLESRAVGARQVPVAFGGLPLEEAGNIIPATSLVVGHVGQCCAERAVRTRVVACLVSHQTQQRLTPPLHGATVFGDAGRSLRLTVLQEVAHVLAGDPFVPREGRACVLEGREQAGARLTNARRFWENVLFAFVSCVALEPNPEAPDKLAAPARGTAGKLRETGTAGGFKRGFGPARRLSNPAPRGGPPGGGVPWGGRAASIGRSARNPMVVLAAKIPPRGPRARAGRRRARG